MNELTPIAANDVKHVSPIMHFLGTLYFDLFIIIPKLCQYCDVVMSLIDTTKNISTYFDNTIIRGSCKIGDPFHLYNFPHMDVVTINFFNYVIKLRIL